MTRPLCSQEMLDVPVRFCEHFCPWRQGPYFPLRVRAGSRAMALSLLSGGLAISGHDIGRHPAALLDARYQAGGVQDPADGRGRRDVQPGLFRVPGNADRVGVPAAAVSSRRVLMMKSRTLSSVARGLLRGLRDRASTASRPPAL